MGVFGNGAAAAPLALVASGSASAVPEPATWGLLAMGFAVVGGAVRRRAATVTVFHRSGRMA
jgi:hypothetical protein